MCRNARGHIFLYQYLMTSTVIDKQRSKNACYSDTQIDEHSYWLFGLHAMIVTFPYETRTYDPVNVS